MESPGPGAGTGDVLMTQLWLVSKELPFLPGAVCEEESKGAWHHRRVPKPEPSGRIQLRLRNGLAPWPGLGWGEGRCSEVLSDPEQVGPVTMQVLEKGTEAQPVSEP